MNAEFLEEAGRLAQAAVERGEGGPFGAVIVSGGQVVSRGWNQVLLACDPTAHAEIVAIRDASRRLGRFHLADCELYSSCEPCPMCLAAAYWARIPAVYYACTRADAAAAGFQDAALYQELTLPAGTMQIRLERADSPAAEAAMAAWRARPDKTLY